MNQPDTPTVERREVFTNQIFFPIAAVLFAAFAFQLWYHSVRASATVDEPPHILAAHRHWQCGDFGINPEHPPLLKLLAAVPLAFRTFNEPPWECGSKMTSKTDSFLYGTKFLVQNGVDSVVIPARLAAMLMSLLLAAAVFAAAWQMFGRAEALIALAILAFEPNIIANGTLVTTDIALTATAFAAVYALYCFCQKPNVSRFVLAGLAVGLMLAAKHSAVIFVPVLFVLVIADALFFRRAETRLPKLIFQRIAAFAGIFLIGLILLWAFYGFRHRAIPNEAAETISIANYIAANGRPETVNSSSARIVTGIGQARIFPESYTLGLADIVATGSRNMYLFDRAYPTGQWFYFPVSFLVKSSVALLLLLPLGLIFPFFNTEKRCEMMFVLVPPLVFFAVALTSKLNIGVRHILPVYAFFIVAAAVGAVWVSRKFYIFRYVLIALLLFHAVTAARVAPDYMAFANDFWGGSDNTYKIFRDPNLDFGQNLKFVNEYVVRKNIKQCWFAPHGNIELVVATSPCRILPGSFALSLSDQPNDAVPPVIEGTVLLTALVLPPRGGTEYAPFAQAEPIDRIARGVFVYEGRFEVPLLAALSHATRANQFIALKRFDEALTDGRKAVELAPDDPRTHLALGLALLLTEQRDEAKQEFEKTIELAKSSPIFRNAEVRAQRELEKLRTN